MKALVFDGTDDFEVREVADPRIQEPTDVILEVECVLSSGTDEHLFDDPDIPEGRIFGADFVGVVHAIGDEVTGFEIGDRVVPGVMTHCGNCSYCQRGIWSHCEEGGWLVGYSLDGGRAEYVRIPLADGNLYSVPDSLENEDVVLAMAGLPTGYESAVRGEIDPGDTVAIIGPGAIGLCALESASLWSPRETIVVGRNDQRLSVAKRMGADHTINADASDAVDLLQDTNDGAGPDVVIETGGTEGAYLAALRAARVGGTVVLSGFHRSRYEMPFDKVWGNVLTVRFGYLSANRIPRLIDLIEAGRLDVTPVINNSIPLEEIRDKSDIMGPDILKTAIYP